MRSCFLSPHQLILLQPLAHLSYTGSIWTCLCFQFNGLSLPFRRLFGLSGLKICLCESLKNSADLTFAEIVCPLRKFQCLGSIPG